ncbi:MAG: hypothetical protein K0R60_1568, partial [Microbacterium sp.]|nr:hypothetical protein [Microbacterium sp.]
ARPDVKTRHGCGGDRNVGPMTDPQTMVRTSISVGDAVFPLAQVPDIHDLKHRILSAVRAGGDFVDFVIVGNRPVSVLITGRERVVVAVETIPYDARDTGDITQPFETFTDDI